MYDQQHHNDPYKNSGQAPQGYGQPAYGQPAYGQPAYGQPAYGQPLQHTYGGDASMQTVTAIKPADTTPAGGCRDLPFGILFIANVGAIVACVVLWGLDAIKKSDGVSSSSRTTPSSKSTFLTADETRNVIVVALGMGVLAVVLGLLSIKLITAYARCMILFTLWFNVAFAFAIAAFGFYIRNVFMGVIGIIFALLSLCYARAVVHRIPFAVANLRVAAAAISKHWSTYLVSIVFTIVQIAWVVLWALAFLGVANQLKTDSATNASLLDNGAQCTDNSQCQSLTCRYTNGYKRCISSSTSGFQNASATNYVVYFFLLISLYWGAQVFKNLAHTTIAGTVATFWYSAESAGATGAALMRTMTTSFGSVCFGSLIVAIIQALRALAEQSRQEGSFLGCLAECLLGCLESIMEYINRWAFVYVGMYGYKFTQAGKAVFQLFRDRGFDAIINDDLIGNVLGFAALAVGLICAGAGAAIAEYTDIVEFKNAIYFLIILGLFVGYGVAVTPLSVVDSSVATIFVCFAEDPAAFAASHPELYQPLVAEWHNLYPEIMVQAAYWR